MFFSTRRSFALLAAATLAACSPAMIPNTQLRDTRDNRAIIALLDRYKSAFESRDAKAILALTSPKYLDSRDGISHDTLEDELEKLFLKVKDSRLDIQVRRIEVEGATATVEYFFSTAYLLDVTNADWRRESDDKRMVLERVEGGWKVMSGF